MWFVARGGLERIACGAQQIGAVSTWRAMPVSLATGAGSRESMGIWYAFTEALLRGMGMGEAMSAARNAK